MQQLSDLVTENQLAALKEIGFEALEAVAGATAEQISEAHGYAETSAAGLILLAKGAIDANARLVEEEPLGPMPGLAIGRIVQCRPSGCDEAIPGIIVQVYDSVDGVVGIVAFTAPRVWLGAGRDHSGFVRARYSQRAQDGDEELDQGAWVWPPEA